MCILVLGLHPVPLLVTLDIAVLVALQAAIDTLQVELKRLRSARTIIAVPTVDGLD